MTSEVSDLITALKDGTMTLEQVAQAFRARIWPRSRRVEPQTSIAVAALALSDPDPPQPGSFDDVTAAYDRGDITSEQYRILSEAVARPVNADVGEPAE
jgi:hypothetical protein